MSDITLDEIRSGYNLSKINNNFQKVEGVINDEVLHTEGGNNTMSQDLDMDSNKVINSGTAVEDRDLVNLGQTKDLVDEGVEEVKKLIAGIRPPLEVTTEQYTTEELIYGSVEGAIVGVVVTTSGFYTAGDGGGASWVLTSGTSAPSQTPESLGVASLSDGDGRVWGFVNDTDSVDVRALGALLNGVNDDQGVCQVALDSFLNVTIPEGTCTLLSGEQDTDHAPYNSLSKSFLVLNKDNQTLTIKGNILYRYDGTLNKDENPNAINISADNCKVEGGFFSTTLVPVDRNIHTAAAVAVSGNNAKVTGVTAVLTPSGVVGYLAEGLLSEGNKHSSTLGSERGCTVSFGLYGCKDSTISKCTSLFGTSDGNIGIFGSSSGNVIDGCFVINRDEDDNPGKNTAQGIFVDSGAQACTVSNNLVDDFYYGIDVKTNISSVNVIGNTVRTKTTGIIFRSGEGNDTVEGGLVSNNTIVFAQGFTDDIAVAPDYVPYNATDNLGPYVTFGVYVANSNAGITISSNVFTVDPVASFSRNVVGVCITGSQAADGAFNDYPSAIIDGNTFNYVRSIGAEFSRVYGPLLAIKGKSDVTPGASPSIVFSNNTMHLPGVGTNVFSLIDGGNARSLNVSGMVIPRLFSNTVITLENISSVNINNNDFGESSRSVINASSCSSVLYSSNTSGLATGNATSVVTPGCDTVLVTGNSFKRGLSSTGFALNHTGGTNTLFQSNYVETTTGTTGVNTDAANRSIDNNIVVSA